jgi:predicted CXXCH cytochrome family protein
MIGQTTSSRRRAAGIPRRLAGMLLMLLGIVMAAGLIGCGTPRERYKTLSFFFDGVPDPDAPAKRGSGGDVQQTVFVGKRIVSQHKPFLDNRCAECHNSATGDIQDFSAAYSACIKCHKKVPTERDLMHGPVARAQCKWCHAPHESTEPALLKDTPIKVCTQCHDKQLLGSNPPEHVDGKTSCLQCHFGHGGTARYFLKPTTLPTGAPDGNTPASADATQPATPATAPAGPPATAAKELSP